MRSPSAVEDDAFLHAEARELALLAEERVGAPATGRRPGSVLHTLAVELSVLMGIGDSRRIDWLVDEASRLLLEEDKADAVSALRGTLSMLRRNARGLSG